MNASEIFRRLDDQFKTLAELVQMSRSQAALISEGRMTDLVALLSKKTPLIEKLQNTASEINQINMAQIAWPAASDQDRARSVQKKCQQLSDELLKIEAACEASLVQSRDAMSEEIADFERAAAASQSYTSRTTDTEGNLSGGGNLDLSCG